ncbi:hypothetical protein [Lentilitoribacter sp. EG35]|uniref:hypothetical protein n=1 Tax=Lentilitoribacter sp. EG35 TaxID=3234192 RepID=UPI003460F083
MLNELFKIEQEILKQVPLIEPPTCCWLMTDSTFSYCPDCAWKARWNEMPTVGPCPDQSAWYLRSEFEELLEEGICGGRDTHSDTVEYCETCGCMLSYLLTDYGQLVELQNFEEFPISGYEKISGELIYEVTRVCMNLDWHGADQIQAKSAIKLAKDLLVAVKNNAQTSSKTEPT